MRFPTALVALLLVSFLAGAAAADTGEVLAEEKISSTQGGLAGPLHNGARFGSSVASLGDLDGDGNIELAVGASRYDPNNAGAVWILFLDPNGRVGSEQRIAEGVGGFDAALGEGRFGSSVAALGDLDGDGTTDLVVGEARADGASLETGSIWLLFLDPNGRVRNQREITEGQSGFSGPLAEDSRFGSSVASLGDLDGDGSIEIAVGAPGDPNGVGTVWLLSLDPNGSVIAEAKIESHAIHADTIHLSRRLTPAHSTSLHVRRRGDLRTLHPRSVRPSPRFLAPTREQCAAPRLA